MRSHLDLVVRLIAALTIAAGVALAVPGGAPAAGLGKSCGGRLGIACDRGLFCDFRAGSCGRSDAEGTCARIPQLCPRLIGRAVCGCDGETYTNNCERARAIVAKRHDGRC